MADPRNSMVALFHEPGQLLELRETTIPQLRAGEVLVRVEACTVCGSDLHTYKGTRGTPKPVILGHEILGRLVAPNSVDDGAGQAVRAGERLIWSIAGSCGHCFYCEAGIPQKCESLFKYGHAEFRPDWPLNGGLAEYCTLRPGTFFLRAPEDLPAQILTPASCATATVAAVIEAAGLLKGQRVLVMGAGMLGVTACAMLESLGAHVFVADINPVRTNLATQFGARHVLDAGHDFVTEVRSLTNGRGVDAALELAGHNSSVALALSSVRTGGTCVLAGSVFPQSAIPVFAEDIVRRLLTIRGVHNYAPRHLVQALEFLQGAARQYPFAKLVDKTFPLQQVVHAFEYALDSGAYRIMIQP